MLIFNDKNVRLQTGMVLLILLVLIIVSQIFVIRMAEDYKKNMVAHDAEIAGYLAGTGIDDHQISLAFTSQKTTMDAEMGRTLLEASGYEESMQNNLLPVVETFHQKYALVALAFSMLFSLFLIAVFFCFVLIRDKKLKNAGKRIQRFMDGDTSVRLADSNEDNLSRFFADVNTMATALTAHVDKEKHSRAFLKETISDISHQLKTPLTALQMYNEIILDEGISNDVVGDFTLKSQRELLRMENLIQNLLKLARLDAGTIELEKIMLKLKMFLEKCRSIFVTRAEQEQKKIRIQCDDSTMLCFDEMWLTEAVGNIIKNALDHTEADDQIELICTETMLATEITVKDNGSGIHPEDIHSVFKRFYRSRYSQNQKGVGIGLALSKSIIEKHGGTITVHSELERGTAFHMIFPKLTEL